MIAHPDNLNSSSASRWMLAVAWLFVGAPALWGVYRTFIQSLALFR